MGCGLCNAEEKIQVVVSVKMQNPTENPAARLSQSSNHPGRAKLFTVHEEGSSFEESVRVLKAGRSQSIGASSYASYAAKRSPGETAKD